jgi:actin-related protein
MSSDRGESGQAIVIDGDHAPAIGVAGEDAPREVLAAPGAVASDGALRMAVLEPAWRQAFATVGLDPRDHPVLLTETALARRDSREAIARTMFERLGVPRLYVAKRGVLALHATGRTTGVAVVLTDDVREVVPIHDGFALLPSVGVLRLDEPVETVARVLHERILDCDRELHAALFGNIVLAGAGSEAAGLAERVRAHLAEVVPGGIRVEVVALVGRRHLSWLGGARLAGRTDVAHRYMTRAEYGEHGAAYVHRRCY